MAHHQLAASVETVHWGWFQSTLAPVLTIASGDRVTVQTVSGGPANLPGAGYHVPPELHDIHRRSERRLPGHILTGPIHVRGAMPGDALEIRIVDVQLRQDWGYTFIRTLAGALPNDFPEHEQMIVALDRARGWIEEIAPHAAGGATPITPKNGRSGNSVPHGRRPTRRSRSSATIICSCSAKSLGSAPASGRMKV